MIEIRTDPWLDCPNCDAPVLETESRDADGYPIWGDGEEDRCKECGLAVWTSVDAESPLEVYCEDEPEDP